MISPVSMFQEGGPWMYVILLLTILSLPAPSVPFGATLAKLRVPAPLWLLVVPFLLVSGLIGTMMGISMTESAVVHASEEMRPMLIAQGYSLSLYTLVGASMGGVIAALSAALWGSLANVLRAGEEPEFTVVPAAAAGGLAVVGAFVLGAGGSFMGAAAGLTMAVALALASIREPGEENLQAASVELRLTVGFAGCTAAALSTLFTYSVGKVMTLQAIAHASKEMRHTLIAHGEAMSSAVMLPGAIAVALFVAATLASVASVVHHLAELRTLASLAVLGLASLVLGAFLLYATSYVGSGFDALMAATS